MIATLNNYIQDIQTDPWIVEMFGGFVRGDQRGRL